MGYRQAIEDDLLPTKGALCGKKLPEGDRERGVHEACFDRYASALEGRAPSEVDEAKFENAMELAPEPLKAEWAEMARDWRRRPAVRRDMVDLGLYHVAMAVSYGAGAEDYVADKVDIALLVVASVGSLARAAGYDQIADQLAKRWATKIYDSTIRFAYDPETPNILAVSTPYNQQFVDAARDWEAVFFRSVRDNKGNFWRLFHERDMRHVVNLLQGIFGGILVLNPDGNLMPLPTMPIPSVPEPGTQGVGPPTSATGETYEYPEASEGLRVGDEVELPDGSTSTIQFINPKRKRIGVGDDPDGKYVWYSLTDIEEVNGQRVATELYEKRKKQNRAEGFTDTPLRPEFPQALPRGLLPHQLEDISFIETHRRVLVADEQGTGKTVVGAVSLEPPAVCVVPAPLKVNWVRELATWRPDLSVAMIQGREEPPQSQKQADVVVINYDILHDHVEWLRDRGHFTVIADEAHRLKTLFIRYDRRERRYEPDPDKSSRRARAFYQLRADVPKLVLMSGTPLLNRLKELWPMLHMLRPQEWRTLREFCERYAAVPEVDIGSGRRALACETPDPETVGELRQRLLERFMIRHTKAQVMPHLGSKWRRSVQVSLSDEYRRRYNRAARDFIAWVQEQGGPEAVMRAQRAMVLVQLTKLRQISASGKAAAVVQNIHEHIESTGRPLVVMGLHKEAFTRIEQGLNKLNEDYDKAKRGRKTPPISKPYRWGKVVGGISHRDRQKAIDAFQEKGELDILMLSLKMAEGLNLFRAQDALIFERMFRPADQEQAEDRLHRKGQKNAVWITYLDAAGTIDDKMGMLLLNKVRTAAQVIDGQDLNAEEAAARVFGDMYDMGDALERIAEDLMEEIERDLEENPEPMSADEIRVACGYADEAEVDAYERKRLRENRISLPEVEVLPADSWYDAI